MPSHSNIATAHGLYPQLQQLQYHSIYQHVDSESSSPGHGIIHPQSFIQQYQSSLIMGNSSTEAQGKLRSVIDEPSCDNENFSDSINNTNHNLFSLKQKKEKHERSNFVETVNYLYNSGMKSMKTERNDLFLEKVQNSQKIEENLLHKENCSSKTVNYEELPHTRERIIKKSIDQKNTQDNAVKENILSIRNDVCYQEKTLKFPEKASNAPTLVENAAVSDEIKDKDCKVMSCSLCNSIVNVDKDQWRDLQNDFTSSSFLQLSEFVTIIMKEINDNFTLKRTKVVCWSCFSILDLLDDLQQQMVVSLC